MTKLLSSFSRDESGATAIEYGVIATIISVVALATLYAIGDGMTVIFELIGAAF